MKKILILLTSLTFVFATSSWDDDYDYAIETAKEEKKIVLLMFSSKTCKVCTYMKTKVYPNKEVQDYINEHFVPVEIDIDEYPQTLGYKLLGTPTYYFLSFEGKQIGEAMIGGAKAHAFLQKLKEVKKASQ
ncbi:MAG: DUF255 domain-containing protein [Thiovulaceae bacterium]|nr:DUF255 domain-containing protein [Sulfurimonadaceae bacterium]